MGRKRSALSKEENDGDVVAQLHVAKKTAKPRVKKQKLEQPLPVLPPQPDVPKPETEAEKLARREARHKKARWDALCKKHSTRIRAAEERFVEMPYLPCERCGSTRRLIKDQLQIRSIDESANVFIKCDRGHVVKY